ncbi:MAG: prepilin-type N-terminal cleavage/methylation domain-containing protein [Blastocatellia bacterium]|nr:prepilin-type N-terminal cleavage/methylation domain-containing protein [Blastocatellia bacterium]
MNESKEIQHDQASDSAGFTLLETIVAMLIMTISLLGALQAINYSVLYNAGNASRAQALALLQLEVELLRAAKFTPGGADNFPPPGNGDCRSDALRDITGGDKPECFVNAANGGRFSITTRVDDNPFNAPNTPDIDPTAQIKEITVEVVLASKTPGWQTAVPARVVIRRSMAN